MLAMLEESKPAKGLPCVLSISLLGVFSTPQHKDLEPQRRAGALLNGENRDENQRCYNNWDRRETGIGEK